MFLNRSIERETGIEPAIFALARRRSTTLLLAHFNVPTDFHFCEGGCIIQKIISVSVNVIAVFIILSAQNRNRTSDTRIFSPLLYQLSYLGIERVMRIELTCSAWKADILPLNYTRK